MYDPGEALKNQTMIHAATIMHYKLCTTVAKSSLVYFHIRILRAIFIIKSRPRPIQYYHFNLFHCLIPSNSYLTACLSHINLMVLSIYHSTRCALFYKRAHLHTPVARVRFPTGARCQHPRYCWPHGRWAGNPRLKYPITTRNGYKIEMVASDAGRNINK